MQMVRMVVKKAVFEVERGYDQNSALPGVRGKGWTSLMRI